jgi:hypothetical protein
MKYSTEEQKTIIENHINTLNILFNKDFDRLSNNDMAFIKNVSLSSIMAMKKKHYTNDRIMTTFAHQPKDETTVIKSAIAGLTDDQLAELGLSRI